MTKFIAKNARAKRLKRCCRAMALFTCVLALLSPKKAYGEYAAGDFAQAINDHCGQGSATAYGGDVLLKKDVTLTKGLSLGAGEVTLLGGGHTISRGGAGDMVTVLGTGALTLEDITLDSCDGGRVAKVSGGGKLTVDKGALLTNGASDLGGGVYVESGTLIMLGGGIYSCAAAMSGGGVYLKSGGNVNMFGGSIVNNSAGASGGGVYAGEGAAFCVQGDAFVYDNTSSTKAEDGGGQGKIDNVMVNSGTVFMVTAPFFGSIGVAGEGFCAISASNYSLTQRDVAGLIADDPSFTVGLTTQTGSGDMAARPRKLLPHVYLDGEGGSDANDGTPLKPVYTFNKAKALLSPGGVIYISGRMPISGSQWWALGEDEVVKRAPGYQGELITVNSSYAHLTLNDITLDGGYTIGTPETMAKDTMICVMQPKTKATLELGAGSTLKGNCFSGGMPGGGAVSVYPGGEVIMREGSGISGNMSTDGGGINLLGGKLTLHGGTIFGNVASGGVGGGVMVGKAGSLDILGDVTISGNLAITEEETRASNVYIEKGAKLEFKDGYDEALKESDELTALGEGLEGAMVSESESTNDEKKQPASIDTVAVDSTTIELIGLGIYNGAKLADGKAAVAAVLSAEERLKKSVVKVTIGPVEPSKIAKKELDRLMSNTNRRGIVAYLFVTVEKSIEGGAFEDVTKLSNAIAISIPRITLLALPVYEHDASPVLVCPYKADYPRLRNKSDAPGTLEYNVPRPATFALAARRSPDEAIPACP